MEKGPAEKKNTGAYLQIIFAMIIFGTIGVFRNYTSLSSSVLALFRALIGAVFLVLFVLIFRIPFSLRSIGQNRWKLLISGTLLGLNWVLLFEAFRFTTVATATLCYYLAPVFVILVSPLILKESLTIKKILCAVVSLIGMVFVSGVLEGERGIQGYKGILFGISAAVCYAGIVLTNKKLKDIGSYEITVSQLVVATVVLAAYSLITMEIRELGKATGLDFGLAVLMGVVHTGIAYMLYFASIQKLSGQTCALFSYIDPVVAIALSAILYRDLTLWIGIGALLILGATLFSELHFENAEKREKTTEGD